MKREAITDKILWTEPFTDGDCFGKTNPEVYEDEYYHVVTGSRHVAIIDSWKDEGELKTKILFLDNRPVSPNKYPTRHKKILGLLRTIYFKDNWYTPKRQRILFTQDHDLDIKTDVAVDEVITA